MDAITTKCQEISVSGIRRKQFSCPEYSSENSFIRMKNTRPVLRIQLSKSLFESEKIVSKNHVAVEPHIGFLNYTSKMARFLRSYRTLFRNIFTQIFGKY